MAHIVVVLVLLALLSVSFTDAIIPEVMLRGKPSGIPKVDLVPEGIMVTSPDGTVLPPLTTTYYFDQLMDHNNPSLGTFQERYWMNWEFYETGGPIILMNAGETNADGLQRYLTNKTINGMIAQQQKGATILIEHRFFGYSNPYDNLTSQSLELLTIQQAIDDLVYFAQNVDLPMPGGNNVKPDTAPWVLVGGSYAGALTSWTMVNKPGVFRAGYASSAVVEAIIGFYDLFTPIREYMPQNCSSDVQAVIAYLDEMYDRNDTAAIQGLKEAFGVGNLSHVDDFAAALQFNLIGWQSLQPDTGPGSAFFQFCDALEVKDGVSAPATGWGLENAIRSWGSFWNNTYYAEVCGDTDAETCLGTYNTSQPKWTNIGQIYQVGPPAGQPAIVSRILQPIYIERRCMNIFSDKFTSPPIPSVGETNSMYKGWNVEVDRLFFANGIRDPWRDITVSAAGLKKANTTLRPIYESNGFHASDMVAENGVVDETVHAVQMAALKHMKAWLS